MINIQNNDSKCFTWCHVRHLNLVSKNPQKITKEDRVTFKKLNYSGINFPVSKKGYCKIEDLNKTRVNVFSYENKAVFPVYLFDKKFNNCLDLLLMSNHYVYIQDFNRLMFNKKTRR